MFDKIVMIFDYIWAIPLTIIVLFAYSTYIGSFYEFTTCMNYLFDEKKFKMLKWIYFVPIVFAVFLPIDVIWNFVDMCVGFIIIPDLIALILLFNEFKNMFKLEELGVSKCKSMI